MPPPLEKGPEIRPSISNHTEEVQTNKTPTPATRTNQNAATSPTREKTPHREESPSLPSSPESHRSDTHSNILRNSTSIERIVSEVMSRINPEFQRASHPSSRPYPLSRPYDVLDYSPQPHHSYYHQQQANAFRNYPAANFQGEKLGQMLSDKTKQKIREDKFVDMHEILHPELDPEYTVKLAAGPDPAFSVVPPPKKKFITENQWTTAFTEYMAVYLEARPSATQEILSYFHMILTMMADQEDWRSYDYSFRKSRDSHAYKWSEVLPKMRFKAGMKPLRSAIINHDLPPQGRKRSFRDYSFRDQGFQANETQEEIQVGYCFNFHTRFRRCNRINCTYKHSCQFCGGRHPNYNHGNSKSSRVPERPEYNRSYQKYASPDRHKRSRSPRWDANSDSPSKAKRASRGKQD